MCSRAVYDLLGQSHEPEGEGDLVLVVGHTHGGHGVVRPAEFRQRLGAGGVQPGPFGGREPVGADQRQLDEGQRGVRLIAPEGCRAILDKILARSRQSPAASAHDSANRKRRRRRGR